MKISKSIYTYLFIVIAILLFVYSNVAAQDFWNPTSGPYGGTILSFTENSSGTLFAGTEGAGVFRSSNNGNNWQEINEGVPIGGGTSGYEIYSILATSTDIFIGTSKEGRIFRSSDDGDNWTQVYASSVLSNIAFCLSSTAGGSILAGLDGTGIIRSTDNGDTWNTTSLTNNNIRQMALADNGDVLAVTNVGVYKSSDDGVSWTLSNNGITNTNTYAIHKNSLGTIFCTAGVSKIFKSTDNGNNWTEVGTGLPSSIIYYLNSNSTNDLYAGTLFGLYKSTNDGNTWTEDGLENKIVKTLHFNSSNDLFAGTEGEGIYRSLQANPSYERTNNGLKNSFITAITFGLDSILYAGSFSSGFFKTSNFGNLWIDITEDIAVSGYPTTVFSLLTHPNGDIIAGTYNRGIFRTTNNGGDWIQELSGLTTFTIFSLALDRQANILAGSQGKLYKSIDNGINWFPIDNDQISYSINDIAVNSLGHVFAATTTGGVFRSTSEGMWEQINNGFIYTDAFAIAINDNDDIFVSGGLAGIYKSTDNGDNWSAVLTATLPSYDIIINDLGDIFVASIDAMGVLRSNDNGATWNQINSGLYSYNIRCLCLSPNTYLFGGGEGTGVWVSASVTGSNLVGSNRNLGLPITYGTPAQNEIVIQPGPKSNQKLSSDNPIENVIVTLQEIDHPDISELIVTLEHEGIVDTLVYQPGVNGANFLGTKFKDDALLNLSQGTAPFAGSFKPYNSLSVFNGLEAAGNWVLTIDDAVPANDGTFEAWSISVSTESSSDVAYTPNYPADFILEQNYPNPFNPTTTIKYSIPNSSYVNLKIYDLLGNEIATLVEGDLPAGTYEHNWGGAGFTSGIYFYRLQAGNLSPSSGQGFVETKKMVLLK